jgi:hypothetical protein
MDKDKIEAWFQKWFHSQPGFSDVQIIWERLQGAKQDLIKIAEDAPALDVSEKTKK